jgi:GAF domain-containing protein/HAMP domain-containing protein
MELRRAILGGQVSLKRLNRIMIERAGLGNTGESYLVSPRKVLLTELKDETYRPLSSVLSSKGIESAVVQRIPGVDTYTNYRGIEVIGIYRWLPDLQVGLITEQDRSEALLALYRITYANLITAVAAILMAIIAGVLVTRRITTPLVNLGKTAERIAAGNLGLAVEVEQQDEIGILASSFNSMTAQLRSLITNLEERVKDRTKAMERRSIQLRVAAEIARDASGLHDLNDLLNGAVNLIRERFGFYHAGIFLLDEKGEYAFLTAATGEAGKQMLANEHKLKVGETGLVGYVTSTGYPRVAMDVGSDAVHFKNPILPDTRSEAALPLKIGQKIIGALDVQSAEQASFDDEAIEVLQILTDQLAVAIENARLIKQMESTVKELETAYGQYTSDSWQDFLQKIQRTRGYRYRGLGPEPITEFLPESLEDAAKSDLTPSSEEAAQTQHFSTISVPMVLRGQPIGSVNIRVKGKGVPAETRGMFEEVIQRLSMNLENVRLLEEAQLKSEQLRLLQDVTSAAAAYVDLQELLTAVASKIREGFNLSHCCVILFSSGSGTSEILEQGQANSQKIVIPFEELNTHENEAIQQAIYLRKANSYYDVQKNLQEKNLRMNALQEYFILRGTEGLVLAPVMSREEVIGLLTLETEDKKRRFVEDDLVLIDQITLQVSTAIDVARLFEQTRERAERERLTSEITTRIRESLEMETVSKTAAKEIRKALNLEEVEIRLGIHIHTREKGNKYDQQIKGDEVDLDGKPVPGTNGKVLHLQNTLEDFREMTRSDWREFFNTWSGYGYICSADDLLSAVIEEPCSEMLSAIQTQKSVFGADGTLYIPIKIREQAAGAMRLAKSRASGSWKENEIQLIEALIDQLGMALESARLYDDTQRRAERERLISEVTARLRASTTIDVIMQTAVQELAEALHVPHGSIILRSEGGGNGHEKE